MNLLLRYYHFLVTLSLATNAAIAQEAHLLSFAKSNIGKFQSEIPGLPRIFVLRWHEQLRAVKYDQHASMLTYTAPSIFFKILFDRCQSAGSYLAQNSYGTKVSVQKMICDRFSIKDVEQWGLHTGEVSMSATPSLLRDIKSNGVLYEVDFEIGDAVKDEIATQRQYLSQPTLHEPFEKSTKSLEVTGRFLALRVFSSDGKNKIGEYLRAVR